MSNENRDGDSHYHREAFGRVNELLPLPPVDLSALTSVKTEDDYAYEDHMHLGRSKVYPVLLKNNETTRKSFQYMALVNHPLQGAQIIHFLNRFVPVKHHGLSSTYPGGREVNEDMIGYISNMVAIDWAYMVSHTSAGEDLRKQLEATHAPANVPGFREFRPHIVYYLNALADARINKEYEIPTDKCESIVPLLHISLDGSNQTWHDGVLNAREINKLYESVNPIISQQRERILDQSVFPDTFAGIAVPAYAKPGLTTWWWPRKQSGQKMSIAQGPVLNWQHKQQHLGTQLMNNLQSYVRESI